MKNDFQPFWIILLVLFITSIAFSQLTIKGMVTDEKGEPLPAANIVIKGTQYGTITDDDGVYILSIPPLEGEIFVEAYYLGYRTGLQKVTKTSGTVTVNFKLKLDALKGDEVVVTGTSIATSRRQLGNAVASVNAGEIRESGARSLDQALSGKIPGALVQQNSGNPGGGITVRLRGTGTVLGSADPLYIVDGVIVNNDSPVLLLLGGYAQNRLVDINPEDIERIEVVKGAAAAALYGSRANNGVIQIFTKRGLQGRPRITYTSKIMFNSLRKKFPINLYPYKMEGDSLLPVKRYDWQNWIFHEGIGNEQYLSVAGGTPTTRYYASGSYFSNKGIIKNSSFKRVSTRIRVDQVLNSWANLTVSGNYIYSWSREIPNGGLASNYGALTGFIFGPNTIDIHPDPVTGKYPKPILANPLEVIDKFDFNQRVNRFIGNSKIIMTPFNGLSLDYTLGIDTYQQDATAFIPIGTTTPGLTNGFSRHATRDILQLNNDLNLQYHTSIGKFMESTTLIGGTLQYERFQTLAAESKDLSPVVQIVSGGATQAIGESRGERIIYGFFAQQTFGFRNRLFTTLAGRIDASSVFGENERWQFYPKASFSYVISEESFWRKNLLSKYIPFMKFRVSIGESGGLTAIGPYDRFTKYVSVSYNAKSGLVPSTQLGAEDIRPERQRETELGIDIGMLDNRIGVEFTYYNQNTTDLLLFRTIAPSTGFTRKLQNVGTLKNKGIELLIRTILIDNTKVRWSSTLTYARNRNKVNGIEENILRFSSGWGLVAAANGYPMPVLYGTKYERNPDGSIKLDNDGLPIRAAERGIIGDPNPDWTGSWINEFRIFKNWNVRIQLDAVIGQDVLNFTRRLGSLYVFGTSKDYEKELRGELPPGYTRRVFGIFEHWVEDGSFVKLRELSLSYTWYPKFANVKSIRFSLIGRNLFSWDNYSGYDPEVNVGGQRTVVRGFDFVEVPIPRTIQLGLTLNL